jgi:hypothetical protein
VWRSFLRTYWDSSDLKKKKIPIKYAEIYFGNETMA